MRVLSQPLYYCLDDVYTILFSVSNLSLCRCDELTALVQTRCNSAVLIWCIVFSVLYILLHILFFKPRVTTVFCLNRILHRNFQIYHYELQYHDCVVNSYNKQLFETTCHNVRRFAHLLRVVVIPL